VRVARRLDAKGAEKGDVLGRVGKVVLAADDVRDVHLQVIHHVDEVKHRLAIGPDDDEIRVGLFAIGQFARDVRPTTRSGMTMGWRSILEFDRALAIVGHALVLEFLDAPPVNLAPLRLEVGAFIPIQPEPAQAAENDIGGFLGIAGRVGVLDAQDKGAAGVAGVKPVEQSRAGAANVQQTRRTGGKTNTNIHAIQFSKNCEKHTPTRANVARKHRETASTFSRQKSRPILNMEQTMLHSF
jgi:hypothetical protein